VGRVVDFPVAEGRQRKVAAGKLSRILGEIYVEFREIQKNFTNLCLNILASALFLAHICCRHRPGTPGRDCLALPALAGAR
jgi:hypothetical protein